MRLLPPTLDLAFEPGSRDMDIAVMMSGGVDSSVAAMLLRDAGWNVVGITMNIPLAQGCDGKRSCCGMEAAYVCRDLGLPHYYVDAREEFEELVVEPFRRSYLQGRTPSPCIDCNTLLKFGALWDFAAAELGIRNFATGHYARIHRDGEDYYLARAGDTSRDQSYFLCGVPLGKLPHLHLPVGDLTKDKTRRLARKAGLLVASRQDSMELCFAGEGDYRAALPPEASRPGPICDTSGNVIGWHNGIAAFTVGQRKGIGIAAKQPLFVIAVRPEDNTVVVGSRDEAMTNTVSASEVNILISDELRPGARAIGKIRSQGFGEPCVVTRFEDGVLQVIFDEPVFAPTPGQRLVLYDSGGHVIVGGVIIAMSVPDSPCE